MNVTIQFSTGENIEHKFYGEDLHNLKSFIGRLFHLEAVVGVKVSKSGVPTGTGNILTLYKTEMGCLRQEGDYPASL